MPGGGSGWKKGNHSRAGSCGGSESWMRACALPIATPRKRLSSRPRVDEPRHGLIGFPQTSPQPSDRERAGLEAACGRSQGAFSLNVSLMP